MNVNNTNEEIKKKFVWRNTDEFMEFGVTECEDIFSETP